MNDNFEKHLRDQSFRPVPARWRAEILQAAREAGVANASPSAGVWWWDSFRAWLWPHPVAWASLAAAWLVIGSVDFASRPRLVAGASKAGRAAAVFTLQDQQRALAEFLDDSRPDATPRIPPAVPRPRSDRRKESFDNYAHA
jgi:hypothetical protein